MFRQLFKYNKDIGHSYVENLNTRVMHENGGYFLKTNSLGFRSDVEFKKKKGKKKRILIFGDSNTAGDGVGNSQRYSDLLGSHLDCEIFNYGLSGTGTDQQYLLFEKYAKDVQADLIILGIWVENIERNKARFRETMNFYNKNLGLTPKPYYILKKNKLELKNSPVPRFLGERKKINKQHVQWATPLNQTFLYKIKSLVTENRIYDYLYENYPRIIDSIRSVIISLFYHPHMNYIDLTSEGALVTQKIIEKFISSVKGTPFIIVPLPTYHFYFDGAKPVYRKLFQKFNNINQKVYVFDPLNDLKTLDYKTKKKISFTKDKFHFSPIGHKLISNFLKNKISKFKILGKIKKRNIIPNLDKKNKENFILGLSAFYHDSAVSIIKNGEIIAAAQEERFTRIKNDKSFPSNAINYCLEEARIDINDLTAIVYYDNPNITFERILWSFIKSFPNNLNVWVKYMPEWINFKFSIPKLIRKKLKYEGKIFYNIHHRSHMASAFFPSPFKKAAILTIDGVGEWATASYGMGDGNKITMIEQMNFPNSLGLLYSAFTKFIGFKVNSGEYKMMGLAPYGEPIYENIILNNLVQINEDGSINIDQSYFEFISGSMMTNQKFADLFGGKALKPNSRITRREMDIAASIQKVTEKVIFKMAAYVKKITKAENLCISGGVALNCVINGHLQKSNLFKKIWIQPASGDAGSSLGCAYDLYYSYFNKERELRKDGYPKQLGSFLGPSFSNTEIKSFLDTAAIKYKLFKNKDLRNSIISKYIKKEKVIGYFSGRSEFGPRALGARSIIGDPRSKNMQTKINLKIKYRESFRPFAPAILMEKAKKYFDSSFESPYMTFISHILKKNRKPFDRGKNDDMLKIVKKPRSNIPAVTHLDFSARVQTVDKTYNPDFYRLLKKFEKSSGCPILINTSFNIRGEPIVNSPIDALRCFLNTEMDYLVLEDYILDKKDFSKNVIKKFKTTNWNFYMNDMNLDKNKYNNMSLKKDLKKIYYSYIADANKEKKDTIKNGWVSVLDKHNSKNIFEIPKNLDKEIFNTELASNDIVNYWENKHLSKRHKQTVVAMLRLTNKYEGIFKNETTDVSSNIYELF